MKYPQPIKDLLADLDILRAYIRAYAHTQNMDYLRTARLLKDFDFRLEELITKGGQTHG